MQPRPHQQRTKEQVIAAIQARQHQGLPLGQAWKNDAKLVGAAVRRFGSWGKAVTAAGFPWQPLRRWTKERVKEAFCRWYRESSDSLHHYDKGLAGAVDHYFGSVGKILGELGLESKYYPWTKQRVIELIQDRYVRGLPLRRWGCPDEKLTGAAIRRFGSFRQAVAAAGLARKLPRRQPVWYLCRQRIIKAIQDRRQKGFSQEHIKKRDRKLVIRARLFFRSWLHALRAAGWEPERKTQPGTRRLRRRRGTIDG